MSECVHSWIMRGVGDDPYWTMSNHTSELGITLGDHPY